MTRKAAHRLVLAIILAMFFAAVFLLYRQLESTRLIDVLDRLKALPRANLVAALLLTSASYLLLTGYDYLAVKYVGRALRAREILFASFVAFAFSNNVGFALMSGGSVRYRIYSALGLSPIEIGEIVAFCTVSYTLGVTTVAGLMFLLAPVGMSSVIGLSSQLVQASGGVLLAATVAYLAAVASCRQPIRLGRYRLRLPSLGSAVMQILLASVDQVLAGAVLYVLLVPNAEINYETFLGIYVIAAPAALLSLVPGGLGVFETMILITLPHAPKVASLGSLVAYRFIYFLLPLVIAVFCVAIYEIRRAPRERSWLRRLSGVLAPGNAERTNAREDRVR